MPHNLELTQAAKYTLNDKLEFVLKVMELEHEHAYTHSQRNAYQQVIRVELELLKRDIEFSRAVDSDDLTSVPF